MKSKKNAPRLDRVKHRQKEEEKVMMVIFFIVLASLTFIHFVYEAILAPSFRARLRLELFKLRDDLRDVKIERGDEISDEVFLYLQSSINGAVIRLSQIDLGLLRHTSKALEQDEKLRKRVAARIAMLEECPVEEVRQIRDRYFELLDHTFAVNSGGWVPYLIPIVFGLIFADTASGLIKSAFSLPENDLNKLAPPHTLA